MKKEPKTKKRSPPGGKKQATDTAKELDWRATSLVAATTFLLSFTLYLLTLAPTVTFEDSGELITAAYHLGVPHQPGYPIFALFGRLFSLLPLDPIAYRLNLMSAFFAAGAAAMLASAVYAVVSKYALRRSDPLAVAASVAAGLLAASAFETWEQAVITEVYGLHAFFTGLVILLITLFHRHAPQGRAHLLLLMWYCAFISLSNHTTALMLLPVVGLFILLEAPQFYRSLNAWLSTAAMMVAGLLPYLYLPLASRRDPWIDWGNPETLTNFLRTVSRHQYGLDSGQSMKAFGSQFSAFSGMLIDQWGVIPSVIVLALALAGLAGIYRRYRTLAIVMSVFLLFAGPLTTYLTNFDVSNPAIREEHLALVSVFYIPAYLAISFLAGIGIYLLGTARKVQSRLPVAAPIALALLLPAAAVYANYQRVDMSNHRHAENYAENLFSSLPQEALLLTNWDPFYFPLNYYQYVEGRRADLIVLDQPLLRRSWYLRWLRDHYPVFMEAVKAPTNAFLEAVRPFEENRPYDGNIIQMHYIKMINAMINSRLDEGHEVYLTYEPNDGVGRGLVSEPVLSAIRIMKPDAPPAQAGFDQVRLNIYSDPDPPDRMIKVFRNYYARLYASRALLMERRGERDKAILFYTIAGSLIPGRSQFALRIYEALNRLRDSLSEPREQSALPGKQ